MNHLSDSDVLRSIFVKKNAYSGTEFKNYTKD